MSTISTRGMGMSKVTHVRQALEQLCSDARNPRTMCARIMAEHEVTIRDVLDVCDMARDVVVAWREPRAQATPTPATPPAQGEPDASLRERIERDKARALGQAGDGKKKTDYDALRAMAQGTSDG